MQAGCKRNFRCERGCRGVSAPHRIRRIASAVGFVLARLSRGTSFRFEQRRVNDEVWLPSHLDIALDARIGLLKRFHAGVEITYSNYKKFQTDSRIVSTESIP